MHLGPAASHHGITQSQDGVKESTRKRSEASAETRYELADERAWTIFRKVALINECQDLGTPRSRGRFVAALKTLALILGSKHNM